MDGFDTYFRPLANDSYETQAEFKMKELKYILLI